ncbi:hypothetical protein BH10ACT11_BH10ACT11_06490 [soil metagenome]
MSLSEYVLELLERDLALPSRSAWSARVAGRTPVEGIDAASAVAEGRSDRDAELAESHRR